MDLTYTKYEFKCGFWIYVMWIYESLVAITTAFALALIKPLVLWW